MLATQIDVGFTKDVLSWTISGFLNCAAKACKCVTSRFRRIGTVPSCGNLKRPSCESSSAQALLLLFLVLHAFSLKNLSPIFLTLLPSL